MADPITSYTDDDDLLNYRPNILNLGKNDWTAKHEEAFDIINRAIIARWYKNWCYDHDIDFTVTEFDPDRLDTDQVKRLIYLTTLALIYLYVMAESPSGHFKGEMELFHNLYNQELKEVLAVGINYDWDESDTIETDEKYLSSRRQLVR